MKLVLHPRQGEAFLSEAGEILYGGAAGGGKSHLLRVASTAWCFDIPGLQVYLFRRLSPDLISNHMEGPTGYPAMLSEFIDQGFAKINYGNSEIHFANGTGGTFRGGSRIFLRHCQYEKDKFKYQGAEIHVLLIDELTHFTDSIYRFLRGRVRLGGLQLPERYAGQFPKIICASNPGNIGHNWVKASFIDLAEPMEAKRMPKVEGGFIRQYIPAKLEDNPTLVDNDPEYEARLEGLGSPELVKAMREGDWNIVAGGMFDDLWREDMHWIKPFPVPSSWRVERAFDWGSSRPFSVGWWAESDGAEIELADGRTRTFPKGTLFRIHELYGWNGRPNEGLKLTAREIAREVRKVEDGFRDVAYLQGVKRVLPGPADSSIFDVENGTSIAEDMATEGVKWRKADKRPGSRVNGWEQLRQRLKASLRTPMEEPGIFIFNTCHHFKRTIPVLPRDENKPDDVDTRAEDHVGDETRYELLKPRGYFDGCDFS